MRRRGGASWCWSGLYNSTSGLTWIGRINPNFCRTSYGIPFFLSPLLFVLLLICLLRYYTFLSFIICARSCCVFFFPSTTPSGAPPPSPTPAPCVSPPFSLLCWNCCHPVHPLPPKAFYTHIYNSCLIFSKVFSPDPRVIGGKHSPMDMTHTHTLPPLPLE